MVKSFSCFARGCVVSRFAVKFVLFIFPATHSLKQDKVFAKLLYRSIEGRDGQVGASLRDSALHDGRNKSG